MELKVPRGTSDLLLEEALKWQYVEQKGRELFERYGYQPIVTPIFEYTELFRKGIGETTDIVQKEMYTFKDRAGRSLTLRPEGTAPVVRAYLEHNLSKLPPPVKLYYIGPMFRYERPQRGRSRQFWQLGVEVIGSADPAADAEVIILCSHYLRDLGLGKLGLLINSMGCGHCQPRFVEALKKALQGKKEFCSDCQRRLEVSPLRLFDCKEEKCRALLEGAPKIIDFLCSDCRNHFDFVQDYLRRNKVTFKIEPALVRGFDYYTGTTFEMVSPCLGAQNALAGGGRYDRLVEEYGGPSTPAVGFAVGTDRVMIALDEEGVKIPSQKSIETYLALVEPDLKPHGFELLTRLRQAGITAEMDLGCRSLKSQMRLANKLGATYTLVLGSEELEKSILQVRDMRSGLQQAVGLKEIVAWLKEKLKSGEKSET